MRKALVISAVIALSACVPPSSDYAGPDYMREGTALLRGKPVVLALQYLGEPSRKESIHDEKMYSWIIRRKSPQGAPAARRETFYSSGIFYDQPVLYRWDCRLDVIEKKDIIVHSQYEGDKVSCGILSGLLKPFVLSEKEQALKSKKEAEVDVIQTVPDGQKSVSPPR